MNNKKLFAKFRAEQKKKEIVSITKEEKVKKYQNFLAKNGIDKELFFNKLKTPDEVDKAIEDFIEYIIDDLTITMDRIYRLNPHYKPDYWLIEWIKKYKKEDYKSL